MEIGISVLVIAVIVVAIWAFLKLKFVRNKFLFIFLLLLIVASFFSFKTAFKGQDISIESLEDVGKISKLYFSWLATAMGNFKILTNNAIKMDWEGNKTT